MSRREDVERRLTILEGKERARAYLEDERRQRESLVPKPETQRDEIARLKKLVAELDKLRRESAEVGDLRREGAKYRHEHERLEVENERGKDLRVEIIDTRNGSTLCKVWRNDILVFDGADFSRQMPAEAPTEHERLEVENERGKDLRVEIIDTRNGSTLCKVWRNDILVFDGADFSRQMPAEAPTEHERLEAKNEELGTALERRAKELERLRKELRDFVNRTRAADAMPNTGDTYHLRWAAASVEKILKED